MTPKFVFLIRIVANTMGSLVLVSITLPKVSCCALTLKHSSVRRNIKYSFFMMLASYLKSNATIFTQKRKVIFIKKKINYLKNNILQRL